MAVYSFPKDDGYFPANRQKLSFFFSDIRLKMGEIAKKMLIVGLFTSFRLATALGRLMTWKRKSQSWSGFFSDDFMDMLPSCCGWRGEVPPVFSV